MSSKRAESGSGMYTVFLATPETLDGPRRLKRAGKPKVRTGCFTWIRHLKCDEEQPHCRRCRLASRECHGYATRGSPSAQQVPSAQHKSIAIVQRPPVLPLVRQLTCSIHGTETERQYFHRFRIEALRGLAIHTANLRSFWDRSLPQIAHRDNAVRHALVALGSTYQLQTQRSRSVSGADTMRLEAFIVQQYNKAIQALQRPQRASLSWSNEAVEITLICCLIFICLEFMRQNREGAQTHLINGLRIIETLPASLFECLQSDSTPNPMGNTWRISKTELRQLFTCYKSVEFCTQVYGGAAINPIVRMHLHQATLRANNHDNDDLSRCQRELDIWLHDVFALLTETYPYKGDETYWSDPAHICQQRDMVERGRRIIHMIDCFMTGPTATRPDTNPLEYVSVLLNKLHARGVFIALRCVPYNFTRRDMRKFEVDFRACLGLCEELAEFIGDSSRPDTKGTEGKIDGAREGPALTLENGILALLHIILYGSGDRKTKRRAMDVLRKMGARSEGLYKADEVLGIFTALGMDGDGSPEDELLLDELVGPTLTGPDGLRGLEAKLKAFRLR